MKRFNTGSGQLDRNLPGLMELLKFIKTVLRFGLLCQCPKAVTRTATIWCLFFPESIRNHVKAGFLQNSKVLLGV